MPQKPKDWDKMYKQFKQKSSNEMAAGCVGCLDDFLQSTDKPARREVANLLEFYSGHYKSYGLNCQVCVKQICN
jgi:hypothetical protein